MSIELSTLPTPLPPSFWDEEAEYLAGVILLWMTDAAQDGVAVGADALDPYGMGFDPALPNAEAAAWARAHTDDLLAKLGTTNQRVVGEVVANWIETPGATLQDLRDALHTVLGGAAYRAELIGRTEVARAYAEGNDRARREAGLPATLFKAPLHPNCRCWDSAEMLPDGTWAVLWQTNRDELVCRSTFQAPFGPISGCRDMHNRVISEGPYFGRRIADVLAGMR